MNMLSDIGSYLWCEITINIVLSFHQINTSFTEEVILSSNVLPFFKETFVKNQETICGSVSVPYSVHCVFAYLSANILLSYLL